LVLSLKAIEEEKNKKMEEKILKEYNNQQLDVTIGDLMKKKNEVIFWGIDV